MKIYKEMKKNISALAIIQLILALFLTQTYLPLLNANNGLFAKEKLSCAKILDKAEEFYYNAEFNKAVDLIRQCFKEPQLTRNNKLRAYRLLTRIFLAKNENDKAEKIARKMLQADPAYTPTIEREKPDYIKLINDLKSELTPKTTVTEPPKKSSKKWIWIGAGAAVVLGTTAIILSGGNKDTQNNKLPDPPQFPAN